MSKFNQPGKPAERSEPSIGAGEVVTIAAIDPKVAGIRPTLEGRSAVIDSYKNGKVMLRLPNGQIVEAGDKSGVFWTKGKVSKTPRIFTMPVITPNS